MVEGRRGVPEEGAYQIEGVPALKQRGKNWCGYTSLSMVLKYWGHTDLTPEVIFKYIQGKEFNPGEEFFHDTPAPVIDTIALAAQELTPLRTDLITEAQYKQLRSKKRTPQDVLKSYIVGRATPCIVRTPGHFMVVTGIDIINNEYTVNDPLKGEEQLSGKRFDHIWSFAEPHYPRDTRYLMLAIYPKKQAQSA